MNNGKRYNSDFKEMIVDLCNSGSKNITEIEREYGVTRSTIYRWIKETTVIEIDENSSITTKDAKQMNKEIARLKEKIEILKKALTIFAKK